MLFLLNAVNGDVRMRSWAIEYEIRLETVHDSEFFDLALRRQSSSHSPALQPAESSVCQRFQEATVLYIRRVFRKNDSAFSCFETTSADPNGNFPVSFCWRKDSVCTL